MIVEKEIYKYKKRIDEAINKYLREGENHTLLDAMRYLPLSGGKRLRPCIALASTKACGGKQQTAMPFAVSLEIIHSFTLIHDDIMDDDVLRRGIPTTHMKYDIPTAINAGDALMARAFEIISEMKIDDITLRRIVHETAKMIRMIGEGQQMDMEFEKRYPDEDEYIKMVEKKTALMFKTAAWGGAVIGGADRKIEKAMAEYGRLMGIGFQIWDDYLSLKGDEKTFGKEIGNDLKRGKKTLIVIHALRNANNKNVIMNVLGNKKALKSEIIKAINEIENCDSLRYASNIASKYCSQAKKNLEVLRPSKEKDFLISLVDYMITRVK